jgi:hypothetical protein
MPRSKLRPEPQPKGVGCSLPQGPGRLLYLAEASFPLSFPVPGERWPRDGVTSIGSAPAGNRPGSLSQLMRAPAAHLPMHGTAGPFQKVVEPYHYSQPVVVVEVGWVIVVAIGGFPPGRTQRPPLAAYRACPLPQPGRPDKDWSYSRFGGRGVCTSSWSLLSGNE